MSRKTPHETESKAEGWDVAILEAEKQLKAWRNKVARLTAALATFREAKDNGKPWPGKGNANAATH
jgi:hypothetical protein